MLQEINRQPLLPATAEKLEQCLALYRGAFLEGFYLRDCPAFETWMLSEQEMWQVRIIDRLDKLARYYLQNKVYLPAITQASHLLDIDPLREASYE